MDTLSVTTSADIGGILYINSGNAHLYGAGKDADLRLESTGNDFNAQIHFVRETSDGTDKVGGSIYMVGDTGGTAGKLCFRSGSNLGSSPAEIHAHMILSGEVLFVGDEENAKMATGITINQGDNDDEILAFKSSDVGHTITDEAEEDTYFTIGKVSGSTGGAWIKGYNTTNYGVLMEGRHATVETAKAAGSNASIMLRGSLQTGNTVGAMSANGNIVTMQNYSNSVWICDAEGDTWQSGNIAADKMVATLGGTDVIPTDSMLTPINSLLTYNNNDSGVWTGLSFRVADNNAATGLILLEKVGARVGDFVFRLRTGPSTSDEIMRMNYSGEVTKPLQPMFDAYLESNKVLGTLDTYETIQFNIVQKEIGNDYNESSGVFTAPVDGVYLLNFYLRINIDTAAGHYQFNLQTDGGNAYIFHDCKWTVDSSYEKFGHSLVVYLDAGDVAYVRVKQQLGDLSTISGGLSYTRFNGVLLG
jgi:hypothetical protein